MAPTSALPIPNPPMPDSPWLNNMDTNRPMSPSRRFKRSMKGVRNFFRHCNPKDLVENNSSDNDTFNNDNDVNNNSRERQQETTHNHHQGGIAVAVTLSAEVELAHQQESNMDLIMATPNTSKNRKIQFLPFHPHYHHYNHQHHYNKNNNSKKAYVHYEPNRGLVAVGNHPDTKHAKTLWLTLEQYAWMVRQLHHEQYVYGLLRDMSNNQGPLSMPSINSSAGWFTSTPSLLPPLSPPQQRDRRLSQQDDPRIASLIGIVINKEDNGSTARINDHRGTGTEEDQHQQNHSMNSITATHTFNTITRRLSRLVQRAKFNQYYHHHYFNHFNLTHHNSHHRTCLLLPKSLILHAAAYIPMTKPLPPSFLPSQQQQPYGPTTTHSQQHQNSSIESPFQPIPNQLSTRLRRYVQLAALCMHDLSLDSTSGLLLCRTCSSTSNSSSSTSSSIVRLKSIPNNATTSDISIVPNTQQQPTIQITRGNDVTFPMTYLHTSIEQRRRTFDSYNYSLYYSSTLSPHHSPSSPTFSSSAVATGIDTGARRSNSQKSHYSNTQQETLANTQQQQQRPRACSAIVTDSVIDPFDSSLLESLTDKRGYVAMDDENQEIVVTFPGIPASGFLFENTSFTPVLWHESLDEMNPQDERDPQQPSYQRKESHAKGTEAYVLECAIAAWRRCELTVATSLMRICRVAPENYRVVIIGHSLGGAVAALCASSLVTTGLLVDRPVTLCTIDSPRVGSASFVEHLAERVETIRITHVSDVWSQMPPRTSGLLHTGSMTITVFDDEYTMKNKEGIIQQDKQGNKNSGYLLQSNDLNWIEDTLADNSVLFSSSLPSAFSQDNDHDGMMVTTQHSSLWGIPLYSTPCQQLRLSSSRYDEKHLCIV